MKHFALHFVGPMHQPVPVEMLQVIPAEQTELCSGKGSNDGLELSVIEAAQDNRPKLYQITLFNARKMSLLCCETEATQFRTIIEEH